MIDAAGAIYVIGGQGAGVSTFYADVWVSTDGGAVRGRTRSKGGGRRVLDGYLQGYSRVLRGTKGVLIGY